MSELNNLRKEYHLQVLQKIIRTTRHPNKNIEYPTFADGGSRNSIAIAWKLVEKLSAYNSSASQNEIVKGQTAGGRFEEITRDYLQKTFDLLAHLRPGKWKYLTSIAISRFDQYQHLAVLDNLSKDNPTLASVLGGDYIIKPDIVIARQPIGTDEINFKPNVFSNEEEIASYSPLILRPQYPDVLLLHASISCKWTLRSDRGQNARTEALNLIRNRKGGLPKIVAVTGEPLPMRIASLALGTGDLDCIYHFALPELKYAIHDLQESGDSGVEDQMSMLETLIEGRRLRDISDLPFDLII